MNPRVLEHVTRGIGFEHCLDYGVLNAGVLPSCHPEPVRCHSERSEESCSAAQGKLREGSRSAALVIIYADNRLGFGSPQQFQQ